MRKVMLKKKNKSIKKSLKSSSNIIENISLLGKEKYKVIITIFSIISIFAGALGYRYFENSQLHDVLISNIDLVNSTEMKPIFFNLLKLDFWFVLLNFFIGTSFFGSVVSIVPPILKSLYIGFYSSYLYNNYELKGVLYSILLLYPCFVITTASLIFLSNENIYMSQYIYKSITDEKSNDNISLKLYIIRYLILITINLIVIFFTSIIVSVLGPKINLI